MYGLFTAVVCAQLKASLILFRTFRKLKENHQSENSDAKKIVNFEKRSPLKINFVNSSQKKSQISSQDREGNTNFVK